jgi:hypothetical protein
MDSKSKPVTKEDLQELYKFLLEHAKAQMKFMQKIIDIAKRSEIPPSCVYTYLEETNKFVVPVATAEHKLQEGLPIETELWEKLVVAKTPRERAEIMFQAAREAELTEKNGKCPSYKSE